MPQETANLLDNLTRAIALAPANPYLYYDRAYAYVQCLEYGRHVAADYMRGYIN